MSLSRDSAIPDSTNTVGRSSGLAVAPSGEAGYPAREASRQRAVQPYQELVNSSVDDDRIAAHDGLVTLSGNVIRIQPEQARHLVHLVARAGDVVKLAQRESGTYRRHV